EEDEPVVEARLLTVSLASRHTGRELETRRREEPRPGARERRVSALEGHPGDRRVVFRVPSALAHPGDDPAREACRLAALVGERGDELLEARVVLGEPRPLRLEQRREPRELLVRREEPFPHDRRRRHG